MKVIFAIVERWGERVVLAYGSHWTYIVSSLMLPCWRQKIAIVLLLSYVSAGALIAVSHHDPADLTTHSSASVTKHGCGTNEIHIPLDKRHECLACMQSAMRTATAVMSSSVMVVDLLFVGPTPANNEITLCTDIFYSGKRGPPILS